MATELLFGIQTNDIRHAEANGMLDIDTTFQMVKEAGVHDYALDITGEIQAEHEFWYRLIHDKIDRTVSLAVCGREI